VVSLLSESSRQDQRGCVRAISWEELCTLRGRWGILERKIVQLVSFPWESAYHVSLTALSENQRAQAHTRFTIIRPALEDGVTQAQVARTHDISKSTIQRWVKRYHGYGLAGLVDAKVRSDKGKSRRLPAEAVTLVKGLAYSSRPRWSG